MKRELDKKRKNIKREEDKEGNQMFGGLKIL
jgi:hypothetical protein